MWVDATIAKCEYCSGGGRVDPAGAWHVLLTWNVAGTTYQGEFWKTATAFSETKPFDQGENLQISINPVRPQEYYFPPAASKAKGRIIALLAGAGIALVVIVITILSGASK